MSEARRCVAGLEFLQEGSERPLSDACKCEAWIVVETTRCWRCQSHETSAQKICIIGAAKLEGWSPLSPSKLKFQILDMQSEDLEFALLAFVLALVQDFFIMLPIPLEWECLFSAIICWK